MRPHFDFSGASVLISPVRLVLRHGFNKDFPSSSCQSVFLSNPYFSTKSTDDDNDYKGFLLSKDGSRTRHAIPLNELRLRMHSEVRVIPRPDLRNQNRSTPESRLVLDLRTL